MSVPGNKSFSKAASSHRNVYNTASLAERYTKGIQMQKFNRLLKLRRAKVFKLPGMSSHHLFYYLDVHLYDK